MRLAASESAAFTTSSMTWLCCSWPARVIPWKSGLRPIWASALRSSGWKSTTSASTHTDQKFSRIQVVLTRSSRRARKEATMRPPSPASICSARVPRNITSTR